jgi:hypothetical protein
MKRTLTILPGNSDHKLTQVEWHDYVLEIGGLIDSWSQNVWFFGAPANWMAWQNACWVIEIMDEDMSGFSMELKLIRERYNQLSIAVVDGTTTFL